MATNDTGSAQSVEPTANDDSGSGFGMIPRRLRGTLTAHEIAIYVALSWRADDFGECWLRLHRLADEAGTSHSTAKRAS